MKNSQFLILEWILLLLALAAFTITETYRPYVTLGLILLLASFTVRILRTHTFLPRTGLELPWLLGLISAAVAVWIAYDQPVALLQFYRLLAAAVIFYAVVAMPKNSLRWLALGFLAAAAGLAVYWPLHTDFSVQPGKLAVITSLGLLANRLLPHLPGPDIQSNVAAGTLVVALPFGAALAVEAHRQRQTWLVGLALLLTLVVLGGLFMTGSRGAWLALLGILCLGGLVWLQRGVLSRTDSPVHVSRGVFWGVVFLGIVFAAAAVYLTGSLDRLVGSIPDPSGGIQSRTQLWRQGWQLVGDYPFTGSGLMSFWMVHSVYGLLLNVPFIAHAHNIFIEVWVEQGVFGLLGLLWAGAVVFTWTWKALGRQEVSIWGWAGLAALTAAALHGVVDVVFYVTRTLPLVGLLFGFAWFLNLPEEPAVVGAQKPNKASTWIIAGLVFTLGLALLVRRPLLGTWYANLGAVEQTHLELSHYDPTLFDKVPLDQVRQSLDLTPSLDNFERSLSYTPENRTALQRRAQAELSLGNYSAALQDAVRLWQAGYRDDVTRLTYGDALVANGQPQAAVQAIQGLTWAEPRLLGQAWARYWLHQDYPRAADAWTAVLMLDPQAPGITDFLQQAQEKIR